MKKYLMVFLAVLLFSSAASAQTQGYIGLFTEEAHTSWCASGHAVPGNFTMWIMVLPEANGTFCAEFMIEMPADPTLIFATTTTHPDASAAIIGTPTTGVSFCYLSCHTGWTFVYSVLMIDTAGNQNTVRIVPHPSAGGPNFTECVGNRDIYPAVIFNNLYVNYTDGVDPECEATATASASWGAIKSLYAD
jgi:hypothetical protein